MLNISALRQMQAIAFGLRTNYKTDARASHTKH